MSGLRPPRTMEALANLREFTRWCEAQDIPDAGIASLLADTSPELGGDLDGNDKTVSQITLKDYSVNVSVANVNSGAISLDYSEGNAYTVTLTANVTAISISNAPAGYGEIFVRFVQDGTGSRTVAGWPSSVEWPGGTAPTITTTATTGTDVVILRTFDGGASWQGTFSQNFS